jgi:hypothetical protein
MVVVVVFEAFSSWSFQDERCLDDRRREESPSPPSRGPQSRTDKYTFLNDSRFLIKVSDEECERPKHPFKLLEDADADDAVTAWFDVFR